MATQTLRRNPSSDQLAGTVSISMASRITGIEVHTLRFWEREFEEFLQPVRTDGDHRRYRAEDIETVHVIKRLLRDEMFSIPGARKHMRELATREMLRAS